MIDLGINLFQEIAALGGGGGYPITNSLRFNDDDSAYLSRTPSVAGNRKTWTWSGWVKRGNLTEGYVFSAGTSGSDRFGIVFNAQGTNEITVIATNGGSNVLQLYTTPVYRDVSGWYHIVFTLDTTQATNSNRAKLYVNGAQVTSFSTANYPSQNTDLQINTTNAHVLGCRGTYSVTELFDGYMAEVNFIDGQALTPDSFGQIDETTGEWSPKAYAGTYGTNGFYLPFKGNANDDSGNGNNWAENNLASTDYMIDTPTNNFSVFNPDTTMSVSEGNLKATTSVTSSWQSVVNTIGVSNNKWYFETCAPQALNSPPYAIIGITTNPNYGSISGDNFLGKTTDSWSYLNNGSKYNNASATTYAASYTNGDVIGCALDMDAGTVEFFKNNVSQGVAYTGLTGTMFCGVSVLTSSGTASNNINFGADSSFAGIKTRQGNTDANGIGDFYYTPPAGGYLALCTDNLSAPVIEQPETQFNVVTYTGNGGTQDITVGFQPDFVWLKERNSAVAHFVYDSVRGATLGIHTNLTDAEGVYSDGLTAFTSDGFTLGSRSNNNGSGDTYVAWCWKAGGTAVSNTDGSITSQVSANVDAGFSIVSWTANTSSPNTIGHGLSQAPDVIIGKRRSIASDWNVYHSANTSAPETETIPLNLTNASTDTSTPWNDTAPTASVFTVGSTYDQNETVIAYCFHSVEGFSKFGSYVGNGSADGPFVYTGFKPAFVMVKRTDSTSNWTIIDNEREGYNVDNDPLYPNLSNAEGTTDLLDILSNGFKCRSTDASINASGGTYIYMAFAEHPFKEALAR